jgi:hypothetical protein
MNGIQASLRGNNNPIRHIPVRSLSFLVCITLSLTCATLLVCPLQATSIQKGFGSVDKNDLVSTVKSNHVTDNTNNKNNLTSEQNVRSKYFVFPSQEAMSNQSINETKRSDAAMLSGRWSVEQSRTIASGLRSLVKEEEKSEMASIDEWTIPGNNGNEFRGRKVRSVGRSIR